VKQSLKSLVAVSALCVAGRLHASPTAIFNTTLFTGSAQTIEFNTIVNEAPITTDFSSQGVVFSGGLYGLTNPGDIDLFPSDGGGGIASDWRYSQGSPTLPWTATFSSTQSLVGFLVEVNSGDTTQISTFLNSNLTGTVSLLSTGITPVFFGVQDLSGFNSISVTVTGPGNHFIAIDNFEYQAIPEPETVALLGAGLVAIGVARTRRHAKRRLDTGSV
jgi:hypothetical protein